jgi:hypothetical protein
MATQPRDPGPDEEEFDEGEEDEDLDEEEDEVASANGVGAAPPPRAAAPAPPAAAPPRRPRRPRAPRAASPAPGFGADPTSQKPQGENAVDMVSDVVQLFATHPQIGTVYDLDIQVFALDGIERMLGSFPFQEILTSTISPGQMLQEIVIDRFHLKMARPPNTYDIKLVWKRTGRIYTRARLRLGSPEEINAIRMGSGPPRPPQAPPGYGSPYGSPPQQAPWMAQPGYPQPSYVAPPQPPPMSGYGYPPPPQQYAPPHPSTDQETMSMRMELAQLRGALTEALNAAREGRQPNVVVPPPTPVGGIPGAPGTRTIEQIVDDSVARGIGALAKTLQERLGLGSAPGGPPSLGDQLRQNLEEVVSAVMREGVAGVAGAMRASMKTQFTGMGAPPPPPEPVEPPEPPEDPMDRLPTDFIATPATWPDGRPVIYPQDKETGEIDVKGIFIGNPFITESVVKLGQTLAEAAKEFAQRPRMPDGTTVVGSIPRGAVDAGVGHVQSPPVERKPAPAASAPSPDAGPTAAPSPASPPPAQVPPKPGFPSR